MEQDHKGSLDVTHRQPEKPTTHWIAIYSAIFFCWGRGLRQLDIPLTAPLNPPSVLSAQHLAISSPGYDPHPHQL